MQRHLQSLRFNLDMFDHYCFEWNSKGFSIKAPNNKKINSTEVTSVICFKSLLSIDEAADFDLSHTENKWIKSWLNCLFYDLAIFAAEKNFCDYGNLGNSNFQKSDK